LEEYLGDPNDPARPFSFAKSLECDEQEVYPQSAEDAIRGWGAAEYLIPSSLEGRLGDLEELFALMRAVARRDLTVAVSFGANLLAALPVWIAGTDQQQQFVASLLREGHGTALAATERGHGTDLLANQTHVDRDQAGDRMTGEKWLISNATKARAVLVFARTAPTGGPRGFSLFLLDKKALPEQQWATLPGVRTVGLRGADVSGLRFRRCPIPEGSLVGDTGRGFETLHRTLTVTKTLCGAIALGAAETALRIVVGFAARRRLYGGRAIDIPDVRARLCGAFLDVLACECVGRAAARALSDPNEPSLFWSALVKYYLPTVVERVLQSLSVVLGARFFLREGPEAFFQKIVRDVSIVSVFEGSTMVNLGILASQLLRRPIGHVESVEDTQRRLSNLYAQPGNLPPMGPAALSLAPLGVDAVMAGLPANDGLERLCRRRFGASSSAPRIIGAGMRRLHDRLRSWEESVRALDNRYDGRPHRQSIRRLDLASEYCHLHAAASCWHTWHHCRPATDEFLARGDWLALCIRRLLARSNASTPFSARSERVFGELIRLWKEDRPFSFALD
jgi:alkylation response protein AidB-like acyl-CoA dehydrogenase